MEGKKQFKVIEDVSTYRDFMSVGDLRKFLAEHPELPDNSKVLVQRVEDVYYEKHGWGVVLKKGLHYHSFKENNARMEEEIKRRKNGEQPKYDMEDPTKYISELDNDLMEQYHPAWCCLMYKDDNNLYIDLHY